MAKHHKLELFLRKVEKLVDNKELNVSKISVYYARFAPAKEAQEEGYLSYLQDVYRNTIVYLSDNYGFNRPDGYTKTNTGFVATGFREFISEEEIQELNNKYSFVSFYKKDTIQVHNHAIADILSMLLDLGIEIAWADLTEYELKPGSGRVHSSKNCKYINLQEMQNMTDLLSYVDKKA